MKQESRTWRAWVAVAVVAAASGPFGLGALSACSGSTVTGGIGSGGACVPGQQIACACAGGEVGAQACSASGEGYGTCSCGTTLPVGDGSVLGDGASGFTEGDGGPGVTLDDGGPGVTNDDGGTGLDGSSSIPPSDGGCDPAAYDFTGTCGTSGSCDQGLASTGPAGDFAKAIGLCAQSADSAHWGVVSAIYTSGHSYADAGGAASFDEQHGIVPTFGSAIVPREGARMGVLSSGSATATDSDEGPLFKGEKNGMQGGSDAGILEGLTGNTGDLPAGFPQTYPGCPTVSTLLNDLIDVKLQIRVPINARGLALDFDFLSGDWPDYVCSSFNDGFIAYLSSSAFNSGTPGNMATDGSGNPVTINAAALPVCTPDVEVGCGSESSEGIDGGSGTSVCSSGPAALAGTGFDGTPTLYCGTVPSTSGGATGWLTSSAAVEPGEVISLELIIWDSGDASFDSSVLLDHFRWLPTAP